MEQERRILVVGSSNVGKTSMLNELCQLGMEANNEAMGCTFGTVELPEYERGSYRYSFFDTAGLNETDHGKVKGDQAVKNITQLIRYAHRGFNLLIFVMRIGSVQRSDTNNYDLFANVLTQRKVPILCVVTGCENEDPITEYANRNRPIYEKNGMLFADIETTCFAKGGKLEHLVYQPVRKESGQRVWQAIDITSSKRPIMFINEENLGTTLKRSWNKFCEWINQPSWQAIVNKDLYDILGRMGIDDEMKRRRIAETVLHTS